MKVIASVVLSSAVVQAAHNACAGATVLMDGMPPANASEFKDIDGADPVFNGVATAATSYHDQFFKYTATCTGVGLIMIDANANFTSTNVDVWTGTCALPVQVGVSDSSSAYTPDDMIVESNYFSSGDQQRHMQFMATNGTEYIIRIGTYNDVNKTDFTGIFTYNIATGCVVPASNNPDMPTVVMGNMTYYYSNVNGSSEVNDCSSNNKVFFSYTAECTGDVSFELVKPDSGYDGFHGEDLKIGFYNYTLTDFVLAEADLCQDDPAIISIFRNTSLAPKSASGSSGNVFEGSVVEGKEYLLLVGSYSSATAPFALQITGPLNCEAPKAETSSAAALALPAVVAATLMLSM